MIIKTKTQLHNVWRTCLSGLPKRISSNPNHEREDSFMEETGVWQSWLSQGSSLAQSSACLYLGAQHKHVRIPIQQAISLKCWMNGKKRSERSIPSHDCKRRSMCDEWMIPPLPIPLPLSPSCRRMVVIWQKKRKSLDHSFDWLRPVLLSWVESSQPAAGSQGSHSLRLAIIFHLPFFSSPPPPFLPINRCKMQNGRMTEALDLHSISFT